jgi:hypothetical protein
MSSAREAAQKLGIVLIEREIVSRNDVSRGLEALGSAHALLVIPAVLPLLFIPT